MDIVEGDKMRTTRADRLAARSKFRRAVIIAGIAILALAVAGISVLAIRKSDTVSQSQCFPASEKIAFVGDSYTNGAGTDSGPKSRYPYLVTKALGTQSQVLGFNGSGYVARGPAPFNVTFPEAAARVSRDASIVVIFGSRNDMGEYAAIRSAATRTFSEVHKAAPLAKLLVVGPPWINNKPNSTVLNARRAVKDAAAAAKVDFVDPIADGWFAETGQIKNGKSTMIASDHIHPNDAGHKYIAARMESALAPRLCDGLDR